MSDCIIYIKDAIINRRILRSLISQLPLQLHDFVSRLTEPLPLLSFFDDDNQIHVSLQPSEFHLFEKIISQRRSLFLLGSSPDLSKLFHPPFLETFLFLTQADRDHDVLELLKLNFLR